MWHREHQLQIEIFIVKPRFPHIIFRKHFCSYQQANTRITYFDKFTKYFYKLTILFAFVRELTLYSRKAKMKEAKRKFCRCHLTNSPKPNKFTTNVTSIYMWNVSEQWTNWKRALKFKFFWEIQSIGLSLIQWLRWFFVWNCFFMIFFVESFCKNVQRHDKTLIFFYFSEESLV